jgi:hypothetical protein
MVHHHIWVKMPLSRLMLPRPVAWMMWFHAKVHTVNRPNTTALFCVAGHKEHSGPSDTPQMQLQQWHTGKHGGICDDDDSVDDTNAWKETLIDIHATEKSDCFVFVINILSHANFFISHFSHHCIVENYSDVIGEFEKQQTWHILMVPLLHLYSVTVWRPWREVTRTWHPHICTLSPAAHFPVFPSSV